MTSPLGEGSQNELAPKQEFKNIWFLYILWILAVKQ